jgi:hypothetical protein
LLETHLRRRPLGSVRFGYLSVPLLFTPLLIV